MNPTWRCLLAATRYQLRAAHGHWFVLIAAISSVACWPWFGMTESQPVLLLMVYMLLVLAPAVLLLGSTTALRTLPVPIPILQLVRWGVILLLAAVAALPLLDLLCHPEIPSWPTHRGLLMLISASPSLCFASNLVAPMMRTSLNWVVMISVGIAAILGMSLFPLFGQETQLLLAIGIGVIGVVLGAAWALVAEPRLQSSPWSNHEPGRAPDGMQAWWLRQISRVNLLGRRLFENPLHLPAAPAAAVRIEAMALMQSPSMILIIIGCMALIACQHYVATLPLCAGTVMYVVTSITNLQVPRLMIGGLLSRQAALLVSLGAQAGLVLCTLLAILLFQTHVEVGMISNRMSCTLDGYLDQVLGQVDVVRVEHGPRLTPAAYRRGLLQQPIGISAAQTQLQTRLQGEYRLPLSQLVAYRAPSAGNGNAPAIVGVYCDRGQVQDRHRLEAMLDAGMGAVLGLLFLSLDSARGGRSWRRQGRLRLSLTILPFVGLVGLAAYGIWNADAEGVAMVSSQFELPVLHLTRFERFALITDEHPLWTLTGMLLVAALTLRVQLRRIRLLEVR